MRSGEADVRKHFGQPLPTLTLDRLRFEFVKFSLIAHNLWAWSGFQVCMGCGGIAFPVFATTSGRRIRTRRNMVTHRTHHRVPTPFPEANFAASNHHASAA